ncbi:MAG: SOS response-associated peptidase [Deltaproteobacteria bacterium]|jgi:putative SOS response-associated peptidase YedK|nr:SOS response-associated peptidase [Deltaproteobacteria bacterium]
MCGRFFIKSDDKELMAIAQAAEAGLSLKVKTGEIFPTDIVAVQTGPGEYRPMKWGFSGFDKRPIINARSETAMEKPTFKRSMLQSRCLVPASGYFEWKKEGSKKIKYQFFRPQSLTLMAGLWRQETGLSTPSFVILTRAASPSLERVHDRMPVILPTNLMEDWLQKSPDALAHAVLEMSFQETGQ